MRLNSKIYELRYSYWKNHLKLLWLVDLGCNSAFRIIKQLTTTSPKEIEYYETIELESRPLLGYCLYDIELIRPCQISSLELQFRGFLAKLNDKQLIHFINGNYSYRDIILKNCRRQGTKLTEVITKTLRIHYGS